MAMAGRRGISASAVAALLLYAFLPITQNGTISNPSDHDLLSSDADSSFIAMNGGSNYGRSLPVTRIGTINEVANQIIVSRSADLILTNTNGSSSYSNASWLATASHTTEDTTAPSAGSETLLYWFVILSMFIAIAFRFLRSARNVSLFAAIWPIFQALLEANGPGLIMSIIGPRVFGPYWLQNPVLEMASLATIAVGISYIRSLRRPDQELVGSLDLVENLRKQLREANLQRKRTSNGSAEFKRQRDKARLGMVEATESAQLASEDFGKRSKSQAASHDEIYKQCQETMDRLEYEKAKVEEELRGTKDSYNTQGLENLDLSQRLDSLKVNNYFKYDNYSLRKQLREAKEASVAKYSLIGTLSEDINRLQNDADATERDRILDEKKEIEEESRRSRAESALALENKDLEAARIAADMRILQSLNTHFKGENRALLLASHKHFIESTQNRRAFAFIETKLERTEFAMQVAEKCERDLIRRNGNLARQLECTEGRHRTEIEHHESALTNSQETLDIAVQAGKNVGRELAAKKRVIAELIRAAKPNDDGKPPNKNSTEISTLQSDLRHANELNDSLVDGKNELIAKVNMLEKHLKSKQDSEVATRQILSGMESEIGEAKRAANEVKRAAKATVQDMQKQLDDEVAARNTARDMMQAEYDGVKDELKTANENIRVLQSLRGPERPVAAMKKDNKQLRKDSTISSIEPTQRSPLLPNSSANGLIFNGPMPSVKPVDINKPPQLSALLPYTSASAFTFSSASPSVKSTDVHRHGNSAPLFGDNGSSTAFTFGSIAKSEMRQIKSGSAAEAGAQHGRDGLAVQKQQEPSPLPEQEVARSAAESGDAQNITAENERTSPLNTQVNQALVLKVKQRSDNSNAASDAALDDLNHSLVTARAEKKALEYELLTKSANFEMLMQFANRETYLQSQAMISRINQLQAKCLQLQDACRQLQSLQLPSRTLASQSESVSAGKTEAQHGEGDLTAPKQQEPSSPPGDGCARGAGERGATPDMRNDNGDLESGDQEKNGAKASRSAKTKADKKDRDRDWALGNPEEVLMKDYTGDKNKDAALKRQKKIVMGARFGASQD